MGVRVLSGLDDRYCWGIPEGIDCTTTESLGLKLVSLLATEQLDGTIQLIRGLGTKYIIVFPGKKP